MQYPRQNKEGKYLTQIMKVNDYVILFTSTTVYIQYLIKERSSQYGWDLELSLFDKELVHILTEYLNILNERDYSEITRLIMFSRTHL